MVGRVGHVRVAWSEWMWPDARPEVPDERPVAWAQHTADLGQAGRRVRPVVHRQGADDQVERPVRECQRGHVADQERRLALTAVPAAVGVGSSASDHGRIEVETGHVKPVLAGQPDRQVAGPATDLEDLCPGRSDRRDVGSDAPQELAEEEPAQCVVGAGMADEDASQHPVPSGGPAAVSHDGDGRGGRSEQNHEPSRLTHHGSSVDPAPYDLRRRHR
ncbi:MAG TPA: hypothetical protein VFU54_05670 [Actinomycetota bacterium]|nr:hypothetical protein [Actinomycetota bacterium]